MAPTAAEPATPLSVAPPGALACQFDSSLRSLATRVARCERVGRFLEVELEDTVLFPEGGGQPSDTGAIDALRVDSVVVRGGRCVHRVAAEGLEGVELAVGQRVTATVDWARRFDHMQQHSAQHLLSAVAEARGLETTTWALGEERCNVELVPAGAQGGRAKSAVPMDELRAIEREANAAIVRGLAVTPALAEPGSAEWASIARKFPPDQQPAAMRVVSIHGLDSNPCCGTHVTNTAQLQALRLLNVEFARGATRVWFVAGERVNREFARMFQREQALTKVLSCSPDEHAARAEKLVAAQKAAAKDVKNLQKELTGFIASELVARATARPQGVVVYHRKDAADLAFLQSLLPALGDAAKASVFVLAGSDTRGRDGMFVIVGPAEFVTKHGREVLPLIEGKGGGGKNGILQGKAADLRALDKLAEELERRLSL